jgi:hypothetical protein
MAGKCKWRGTTSKGRVLPVGVNNSPPTVAASEFASCTSTNRARRFGYPPPLVSTADGGYSAWCLDDDESIVSVEPYDCTDYIDPSVPCDCINGGCLPKTVYGTPGVFANLAACQSGCAKNSNCTGECVDPAEIAAHRQALNNLQSKICR